MNFDDSQLFISARSPFARRVRLALMEHCIRYEEKVLDVFQPNPEFYLLNPLARVPTIRFKDGSVLVESEKILAALYRAYPKSRLLPANEVEQVTADFWSAMALGLCEKSIEFYLESLRPESARDEELLTEIRDIAARVLERFDTFIAGRETILDGRLTQVDFDMGTALAYFSLRYSSQWRNRYTHAAEYLQCLEELPSFHATRPPAPSV